MTPGTNASLYVAGGSLVTIIAVAAAVRAISPPTRDSAPASSNRPLLTVGGSRGMPPPAASGGAGYRVEEAVPIMLGGQTGLAVRFSGDRLDSEGKELAARDIFRRMKDDAEEAGVQVIVISYGADLPAPGEKPSDEDSFLFMRQPDGTWARIRTGAPAGASGSAPAPSPSAVRPPSTK